LNSKYGPESESKRERCWVRISKLSHLLEQTGRFAGEGTADGSNTFISDGASAEFALFDITTGKYYGKFTERASNSSQVTTTSNSGIRDATAADLADNLKKGIDESLRTYFGNPEVQTESK